MLCFPKILQVLHHLESIWKLLKRKVEGKLKLAHARIPLATLTCTSFCVLVLCHCLPMPAVYSR